MAEPVPIHPFSRDAARTTAMEEVRAALDRTRHLARDITDQLRELVGRELADSRTVPGLIGAMTVRGGTSPNMELVYRILRSHKIAEREAGPNMEGSVWPDVFRGRHAEYDALLRTEDAAGAAAVLYDPAGNSLLYGVENLTQVVVETHLQSDHLAAALVCFRQLQQLARAVGAPEEAGEPTPTALELIGRIESVWSVPFPIPNPYRGECGVATGRGVVSQELLRSASLAWRIRQLLGRRRGRVVEIGSGLGRLAVYSHALGVGAYVSVETPVCRAAQAAYLGAVIGADQIRLFGEDTDRSEAAIIVESPEGLMASDIRADLVVAANVVTDLSPYWRSAYLDVAASFGRLLLLDTEGNSTAIDRWLEADSRVVAVHRHPSWLSTAWVERLVEFG